MTQIVGDEYGKDGINTKELRSCSRRHPVCRVWFRIAIKLFSEYGIHIAEMAGKTSDSTSGVSKMVNSTSLRSEIHNSEKQYIFGL